MAKTSLAEQLRKLAAPQTSLLVHRKTRPSLLFDPSEAAEIDRSTFYDIGVSGLNELREINEVFEEFQTSLFDESSKSIERAVETFDVNHQLNLTIKKFLILASPYFLLKATQKALEWLIVRFHIHDYNSNDLICCALPYHGTRLFARLLQVFNLKNSHPQWQWLYPLQKKGIPLSKLALFNHCSSDVSFLKMICDFTIDSVKIFETNASKLATLYAFYSTTLIGTIQNLNEITEVHLTHMLPSILVGLSTGCIDYCASSFMIISSILTKSTFQERLRTKLTDNIAKVPHPALNKSMVLLLNILYQSEKLEKSKLTERTIRSLVTNPDFIPCLMSFLTSGIHTNIFYLILIRDSLNLLNDRPDDDQLWQFIRNLINSCQVDDICAEKMIRIVIDEAQKSYDVRCCELVKSLENQYPHAWDNVITSLFKGEPSESLSHVLGFTSVTSQVDVFQKLNHPVAALRAEAIKNLAKNSNSVKVKYIENSLRARWNDENPTVIEAMFSLPANLRFSSNEVFEKLLLRSWLESNEQWNSLLLKVLEALQTSKDLRIHSTKYSVLLLPFLLSSSTEIRALILEIDLPLFSALKKEHNAHTTLFEALKNCKKLPAVNEFIEVYQTLSKEHVHVFTSVLLLSFVYERADIDEKSKILTFFFDEIFPIHFQKVKWRQKTNWKDEFLPDYYLQTVHQIPAEIAYKFIETIIEQTACVEKFSCSGWCDFANEYSNIALLYKYLNQCSKLNVDVDNNIFVSPLIEKLFDSLPGQLNFLCNMCIIYQHEPEILSKSLKLMHKLLSNSNESYSWALITKSDNTIVPCMLILLYTPESEIRSQTMKIIEILTQSIGAAFAKEITYVEFLKHLQQFAEEIILDRDQLQSRSYAFLAQDDDIQSLLPASVRCVTKIFHDSLFECVTDERTPLLVAASLLQVFEYFKDSVVMRKLVPLASRVVQRSSYVNDAGSFIVRAIIDKFNVGAINVLEDDVVFEFVDYCVQNYASVKIRTENGVASIGTILLQKFAIDLFDALDDARQKYFLDFVLGERAQLITRARMVSLLEGRAPEASIRGDD